MGMLVQCWAMERASNRLRMLITMRATPAGIVLGRKDSAPEEGWSRYFSSIMATWGRTTRSMMPVADMAGLFGENSVGKRKSRACGLQTFSRSKRQIPRKTPLKYLLRRESHVTSPLESSSYAVVSGQTASSGNL
jgi:hypothetical protein